MSAAAVGALLMTSSITPVMAKEKTVMVGGAAMYPSKNIVENAVHSRGSHHAGGGGEGRGPRRYAVGRGTVHRVRAPPTPRSANCRRAPVETLVKPENKATLTKISPAVSCPAGSEAADLTDGKTLTTGGR